MTTERKTNAITEGVIWKQLLIFFFPILLGTFLQQLYNTVDAMIVGKAVGKEALGAVGGATATIISLLVGFFVGISSGATVVISQFYGGRHAQNTARAVHSAIALALCCSALLTAIGLIFAPVLLRMMGTPEAVLPHALTYMRIYFAGITASVIYNIGAGILRAVGDSRRPLAVLVVSCLTNIVLDLLFVVGLHMGVAGAALATILSQAVAAALVTAFLIRARDSYRLRLREIRVHADMLQPMLRIGLPAGVQSVLYSISNVVIQAAINSFGTDVVAGYTAASKMDNFYWVIISSMGIAITTFAGQNFGSGRYDRLKKSVRVGLALSVGITVVMCTLLLTVGARLLWLFSEDEAVLAQGLVVMRFMVPIYMTYVCVEVFSGALRGAGDSLVPTLMSLFAVCLLRMLWVAIVVPRHHTLTAVLASYPVSWSICSIMFVVYYLKSPWLERCILRAKSFAPS